MVCDRQVTKHDDVFMLDGEGMPTVGNPFVKGRLFVIFKVSLRLRRFLSFFAFRSLPHGRQRDVSNLLNRGTVSHLWQLMICLSIYLQIYDLRTVVPHLPL